MTYYEFTPENSLRRANLFLMQAAGCLATAMVLLLVLPQPVSLVVQWIVCIMAGVGMAAGLWMWAQIIASAARSYDDYLGSQSLAAIEDCARSVACDECTHSILSEHVSRRRLDLFV